MPSIIWSLTKAESKCLDNRWEFVDRSYSAKEVGFFLRTAEILGDVEDNSPLPLSLLMLAGSFDPELCLEIPNRSG
jgi:hypothetical protein